jgi:TonB family protein
MKPLTMTVTIDKKKNPGYLVMQPDEATLKKYHSQHAFYPIEEETKDTVKPSALPAVPSEPEQAEPQEEPEKDPEPAKEPASERDVVPEPMSVQSDMICVEIDEQASFPGQTVSRFIMTNLRYPQKAIDYNIQGKVIVRFVVSTTGDITDVRIVKSMNLPMDEECVRMIKTMPRWVPAKHNGKEVNSWFNLPVAFKLK